MMLYIGVCSKFYFSLKILIKGECLVLHTMCDTLKNSGISGELVILVN